MVPKGIVLTDKPVQGKGQACNGTVHFFSGLIWVFRVGMERRGKGIGLKVLDMQMGIVENVGFGGTHAAPIAKKVIETYLNTLKDKSTINSKTISKLEKSKLEQNIAN